MPEEGRVQIFEKTKEKVFSELLSAFKIKADSVSLKEQEYFDIYDIRLRHGEKASKVDRALGDLGLSLMAHAYPTGSMMMDRGIYRVHVQTKQISPPSFEQAYSSLDENHYIPITLGADSHSKMLSLDMNKMPNVLIGGTTGSGKSVLLHNFILSLIGKKSAVYLVDPKMVEFSIYKDVPSVAKIVHSVEDSIDVIGEITVIMEERFTILQKARARDAREFNLSFPKKPRMNPIILVIDEWADLTLQNKAIQKKLCLLAQKGRAAGISIILATQRPSSNVVSGLIKANFPARIALKVASAVDSRVILDSNGAEKITDIGTGLYIDASLSTPRLFRAPKITDIEEELSRLGVKRRKPSFWSKFF